MKTTYRIFCGAILCIFCHSLFSQDSLLLEESVLVGCPDPLPAIGLAVPDVYQKGYAGMLTLGGTLQSRTRLSGDVFDPDGNISFGLGIGNPTKIVGAEIRTNIYGLFANRGAGDNFGEGTIDLHLSRMLTKNIWLGGGVYDLTGWKREEPNQLYSGYVAMTTVFPVRDSGAFQKIYLTIGAGNGRFRNDEKFDVMEESGVGVIGALAVSLSSRSNFFAEWKGYNLVSGFSFIPFRKIPGQLAVGMNDIFHENRSFLFAGSLSFSLFHGKNESCSKQKGWFGPPPPQPSRI